MVQLRFVIVVVFISIAYFALSESLECGIEKTTNNKDLQQIAENCMKKDKKDEKKINSNNSEEEEEETTDNSYESRHKLKQRNKRSDNNFDNNRHESDNKNNSKSEKDNCVVNCIFTQLGLVDSEGFPLHHRVAQALLNNSRSRELRDFVQDTADECFQLMEQGTQSDPCQYSITLVNCLAERGKSNCADWPIGKLPFLSKKNQ